MNKSTEKGLQFKSSNFPYYYNLNGKLLKTLIHFQTANIKLAKCHSLHSLKLQEVPFTTLTQSRITLKRMQYTTLLATCYSVQKSQTRRVARFQSYCYAQMDTISFQIMSTYNMLYIQIKSYMSYTQRR